MLLYTLYTQKKVDSWNREKVYAFCSVQRYIECLRQNKQLKPITQKEALNHSSLAHLYIGEKGNENGCADDMINISENAIRDSWDGKFIEIKLVETREEETYFKNKSYA